MWQAWLPINLTTFLRAQNSEHYSLGNCTLVTQQKAVRRSASVAVKASGHASGKNAESFHTRTNLLEEWSANQLQLPYVKESEEQKLGHGEDNCAIPPPPTPDPPSPKYIYYIFKGLLGNRHTGWNSGYIKFQSDRKQLPQTEVLTLRWTLPCFAPVSSCSGCG